MKKALIAMLLLVLVIPGLALADNSPLVLKVGDTVTELKVVDLDGNSVNLLKAFDSDNAIISFMNTSCTACLSELRMVSKLSREKNTDLLIVSVDMMTNRLASYMKTNRLETGTMYHDPDFKTPRIFGFNYTPGLVVIDKAGKILYLKGGWNNKHASVIAEQISDLL